MSQSIQDRYGRTPVMPGTERCQMHADRNKYGGCQGWGAMGTSCLVGRGGKMTRLCRWMVLAA